MAGETRRWSMAPESMPPPPPAPLPPPLPPPPRFTLPLAAWIAWGLWAAVLITRFVMEDRAHGAHEAGELSGRIVAMLLFPTLLAWVIWRFTGRRPLTRTLVFFAVFALSIIGQVSPSRPRSSNQTDAAYNRLQQDRQKMEAEQRSALKSGKQPDPEKAAAFVDRTAEHMGQLAKNSTGTDRATAEAGQAFVADFAAITRRYNEAAAALSVSTFFTLTPALTEEQIETKRRAVNAFAEANAQMQAAQAGGAERLKQELEKRGVPTERVRSTLKGYESSTAAKLPLLLKIREADARLAEAMLDFLDLAAGKHGAWKVDEAGGTPVFENPATSTRYDELLERVRTIGAEQVEYQQRALAVSK